MLVDCGGCVVRGDACGGCVISAVVDPPPGGVEFDQAEWRALAVLADAGLLPRLRLVTEGDPPAGRPGTPPPRDAPAPRPSAAPPRAMASEGGRAGKTGRATVHARRRGGVAQRVRRVA